MPRFLFSSSCSLYGAGGDELLDENAAFNPVTAYGESKVRVEQEVSKLADDEFSPVYLRNATAYGVSRRLRADIVVNNLVGHAVTTGKVLLQSDGTPVAAARPHPRHHPRLRSVSRARPRTPSTTRRSTSAGSSENYRIREVAEHGGRGRARTARSTFAAGASADTRNYRVDFRKIETKLPGLRTRRGRCARASRSCTRPTPRPTCPSRTGTGRGTTG